MYNHTNSIYSYVAVNVYLYIYALHGFFLHTVCLLEMRVTAVKQDFWKSECSTLTGMLCL